MDKLCVMMTSGYSWTTEDGEIFTKDDPFKLLDRPVAERLVEFNAPRFRYASREEVGQFYRKDGDDSLEKSAIDIIAG